MKKIIGIIGIIAIAMTMFFKVNTVSNNDLNLASLIAINTANAEEFAPGCYFTNSFTDLCRSYDGIYVSKCINLDYPGSNCPY